MLDFTINEEALEFVETVQISTGSVVRISVVVVNLCKGGVTGTGEGCPVSLFGEPMGLAKGEIRQALIEAGPELSRRWLLQHMRPGPGRNSLDCALWDLEAKQRGMAVWTIAGVPPSDRLTCARTICMLPAHEMAKQAKAWAHYPLLKLKLGAPGDEDRLRASREAAPDTRLIVDANGAWTQRRLEELIPICLETGVELLEQPLARGADDSLAGFDSPIPIAADESFRTIADLPDVSLRYDAVNIKLDKAGGLTQALLLVEAAREAGLKLLAGCMISTSLGCSPAFVVATLCDWVDLDSPLLLKTDHTGLLDYRDGYMSVVDAASWGRLGAT